MPWWKRKRCRGAALLILLLTIGGVVGLVLGLPKGAGGASAALGEVESELAGEGGSGSMPSTADPMEPSEDPPDEFSLTPLEVNRSCEYKESEAVSLNVADNGVNNRFYGGRTALDGEDAVVVSYSFSGRGAVWVLSKSEGVWEQTALQSDGEDKLGWDVAINGGTAAVGAPTHGMAGAVFVLAKVRGGDWYEQETLLPEVTDPNSQFGISVDVSECGCFIAVGAWHDREGRGSVHIFSKSSSGKWTESQKLSPNNLKTQSAFFHGNFGHSVAMSDTLLVVKAPFDYVNRLRGLVYIYNRGGDGKYTEMQRLSTPEGSDAVRKHSSQVAVTGDFVLAGAPGLDRVYAFRRTDSGGYRKTADVVRPGSIPGDGFGFRVSGRGADVLVEERGGEGSYLFSYGGGAWGERAKFEGRHAVLSGDGMLAHSRSGFNLKEGIYSGQVNFYDLVCD